MKVSYIGPKLPDWQYSVLAAWRGVKWLSAGVLPGAFRASFSSSAEMADLFNCRFFFVCCTTASSSLAGEIVILALDDFPSSTGANGGRLGFLAALLIGGLLASLKCA